MPIPTLTSGELELLNEALFRLRETKVNAHREILTVPGHESFKAEDFGIPQIDALIKKVDAMHDLVEA